MPSLSNINIAISAKKSIEIMTLPIEQLHFHLD